MSLELVLLPRPQRLCVRGGEHRLQAGRFILLAGEPRDDLVRVGLRVQEVLAEVGPRWELTAAAGNAPERVGVIIHVDPAQVARRDGYRLVINPGQVLIVAHDPAGAFYAAMTLRQIARQCGGTGCLPCLYIEDWPDFPHRGVMLDISRDKVPRMETLYALVDLLAEWKVNQFQLYMEHTFAYRNHREVWEKASPMTGEEILELDAYCRERYVELVPNQNSFGHMARWLVHPRYNPLAEAPEGCETAWGKFRGPFSLCPLDPGAIALLAELYEELLPHFTSRQFNVGCDETVDLGRGRSRVVCERLGVGRVYLDFLLKIHRLVQRHGRTMQFWGDIILHHPELIEALPDGIIALEWGYEAGHPFARDSARFAEAGVPFYVCPGTSSWNSIAGRTENAVANLRDAAENGLACGAIGYLNTDWGDNGHWQPLPVSYPGYACGAAFSWSLRANRGLDLARALDLHAFKDSAGKMGRLTLDLGNAYKVAGVPTGNASVLARLLYNPSQPRDEGWMAKLTVEGLEKTLDYINGVVASLSGARMACEDAEQIADEFANAADLLRHACRLGIARLRAEKGEVAAIPAPTRAALAEELGAIVTQYRTLWLSRNREGGLSDSVARMERLIAMYRGEQW